MWDEITYPFPVRERMSYFIIHFTGHISSTLWSKLINVSVKGPWSIDHFLVFSYKAIFHSGCQQSMDVITFGLLRCGLARAISLLACKYSIDVLVFRRSLPEETRPDQVLAHWLDHRNKNEIGIEIECFHWKQYMFKMFAILFRS